MFIQDSPEKGSPGITVLPFFPLYGSWSEGRGKSSPLFPPPSSDGKGFAIKQRLHFHS